MRAALLEAIDTLDVVDDVEVETPRSGEVLVEVHHCGVCHSDLHFVDGSMPCPRPSILGHEASGVVLEVGSGVDGLAPGDKVILTLRPPCGRCYWCVRGEHSLCPTYVGGLGNLPGGGTRLSHRGRRVSRGFTLLAAFAERTVVPAAAAVKVAGDTPLDIASVVGCAVQTGVGAVLNTSKVPAGATVLIFGLGGIGVSIAQGARIAGAARIIGVDPVAERRHLATRFGVTDTLDPEAGDVVGAVQELTGGTGVDFAYDAVGRSDLVEAALAAARPGGMAVMVGVPKMTERLSLHAMSFGIAEKKLVGCLLGSSNPHRDFPRILALWRAGRLDLEGMVTARRPLTEITTAFDDMKAGRGLRTVLDVVRC